MNRTALVTGPAAAYAAVGAFALVRPEEVPAIFGGAACTPASRTEIRTVYGGLCLAFAGALGLAARSSAPEANGVVGTMAVASAGMAAGRLAGAVAERELRPWPTGAFLALEAALAGALLAAVRIRPGSSDHRAS